MTVELTHVELVDFEKPKSLHDAPKEKSWSNAGDMIPLDLGGPVDVPFERFEDEWIALPLMKRFEQVALRYADRIAVDDGKIRLTYRALRYAVYRLAKQIETIPSNGKPIGVLLPHDARFPLAALACFAIGRTYVPIDVKLPVARILEVIAETGMHTVILDASGDTALMLPQVLTRIDIAIALRAGGEASKPNKPQVSVIAPAVVHYTSGSTGKPKGICNSQLGILQRVAATVNSYHLHAGDRVILLSSLGTVAGLREAFSALLSGAALYVADPHRHGIGGVLKVLQEARITICYTVPPLLRTLLQESGAQQVFSHLRIMHISGDVALESDLDLCRLILPASGHILISFSSTEMPNAFQWFVPRDWKGNGMRVPIGYPQPDVNFMIVNEDDKPVAPGEIGELIVRSRYSAIGQWQYGSLQPGPFLPDPHDPWLLVQHTRDMMMQREDGLWELVGRKDRKTKIRGQHVDPGEVEAVLRNGDVSDVTDIERHLHKPPQGVADNSRADKLPVLFLLPGILGDEPLLAHFRAAFGENMRFKVIDYPEWRGASDAHASFDAIVNAAFAQICAEPACQSYALAGYSFGGYVAFETARRLAASGRRVDFLGLIDSRTHGISSAMGHRCALSLRAQLKQVASMLFDPVTVMRILLKRSVALGRYATWAMASRPSTTISFTFYRERNYQQRINAVRRWKFTPLDLPVTLFLSDQGLSELPPDYGWGKLCKKLNVAHIGGTHTSVLESPRREILRRHFLEALQPATKLVVA